MLGDGSDGETVGVSQTTFGRALAGVTYSCLIAARCDIRPRAVGSLVLWQDIKRI